MTDKEVAKAWGHREQLAKWLLDTARMIVESHPEAFRELAALAFDCPALLNGIKQHTAMLQANAVSIGRQHLRLGERDKRMEEQDRHMDGLEMRIDRARAAIVQLEALLRKAMAA